MVTQKNLVIAFAGNGNVTPANVKALLDDQLTFERDVENFYVPEEITVRKQPGLAHVVAYLTKYWGEDGEDGFQTAPVSGLYEVLQAASEESDAVLVIIQGDEEAEDDVADLVENAINAGITVLDLAAGLDQVEAAAAEDPPEPAEEPVEAPTRRRRVANAPPEDEPSEAVSEPRAKRQRGKPRTPAEVKEVGDKALDGLKAESIKALVDELAPDTSRGTTDDPPFDGPYAEGVTSVSASPVTVLDSTTGTDEIRRIVGDVVREVLAEVLSAALGAAGARAVTYREGGYFAPVQELPAAGPTTAFIKDEDGTLRRRGRGKPRSGEEVVHLTKSQAAAAGFEE